MANTVNQKDSANRTAHVIDGVINEWKIDKFETDLETQVLYSVDNDANNLYLAMKIPNQQTQMKMMTLGMTLYLDKKGKKREGTGIEFPIKREGGGGGFRGGGDQAQGGRAPDPKAMRDRLANMMIFLKSFGFDDQEDKSQLIAVQNSINIAFEWDDANTLYIEYLVPLSFMGGQVALTGKPLGIGWRINRLDAPQPTPTVVTTTLVGVPAGSGGRSDGGRNPASFGRDIFAGTNSNTSKVQSFWTKYTLHF